MNKRAVGGVYEEWAAAYLIGKGYEIIRQNYRDRYGEIDIIAREGRYLVFVEVKYRRDEKKGSPAEAVDSKKVQRIRRTAQYYLYQNGVREDTPCRFDVVSILGDQIQVIKDAF